MVTNSSDDNISPSFASGTDPVTSSSLTRNADVTLKMTSAPTTLPNKTEPLVC
ncbi:hypothetical protein GCK32_019837 [Trichostrongylus colubriformis]|uniref:Uncharacterized protein n=1 Tax=Trichostrongylus colubriformis TaxID=6319 RepID=A0AAN8J011_TRICO